MYQNVFPNRLRTFLIVKYSIRCLWGSAANTQSRPARTMRKDKLYFFVDYISGSRYAPTWEASTPKTCTALKNVTADPKSHLLIEESKRKTRKSPWRLPPKVNLKSLKKWASQHFLTLAFRTYFRWQPLRSQGSSKLWPELGRFSHAGFSVFWQPKPENIRLAGPAARQDSALDHPSHRRAVQPLGEVSRSQEDSGGDQVHYYAPRSRRVRGRKLQHVTAIYVSTHMGYATSMGQLSPTSSTIGGANHPGRRLSRRFRIGAAPMSSLRRNLRDCCAHSNTRTVYLRGALWMTTPTKTTSFFTNARQTKGRWSVVCGGRPSLESASSLTWMASRNWGSLIWSMGCLSKNSHLATNSLFLHL